MGDTTPLLNVVHHEHSRIEHVDVGKYEVDMRVHVAMVHTSREMVFFQFFIDNTPQDLPWLWHSDGGETQTGWCKQTLTLAPNTTPNISIRLVWRHDKDLPPIFLAKLHVPAAVDPREHNFFYRERILAQRRREERRLHKRPYPAPRSWLRRTVDWLLNMRLLVVVLAVLITSCGGKDNPYLDRQQFDLPVNGTVVITAKPLAPYTRYTIRFSSPHNLAWTFRYDKWLGFFMGGYTTLWHFELDGAEQVGGYEEGGEDRLINHVVFKARGTGQPLKIRTSKDLTAAFAAPTLSVLVLQSRGWRTSDGTSLLPVLYIVLGIVGFVIVCGLFSSRDDTTTYAAPVRVTPTPEPNPRKQRLLAWVTKHERWLLDHENLTEPSYQKHLLWRHRRAYHEAMRKWTPHANALHLPPYPMAIPLTEWRESCDALNDRDLCTHLAAHEPRLLHILNAMQYLSREAEKVVIRPSTANDHLAVMDGQLEQLNSINTRADEMQEKIRADVRLSDGEKKEQIKWIQQLRDQRLQELLKEHDDGSTKDEVISPE